MEKSIQLLHSEQCRNIWIIRDERGTFITINISSIQLISERRRIWDVALAKNGGRLWTKFGKEEHREWPRTSRKTIHQTLNKYSYLILQPNLLKIFSEMKSIKTLWEDGFLADIHEGSSHRRLIIRQHHWTSLIVDNGMGSYSCATLATLFTLSVHIKKY